MTQPIEKNPIDADILKHLFDMVSDFAFVFDVFADGSWEISWMSESYTQVTGYDKSDVESALSQAIIYHPDDRERMLHEITNIVLKEGKPTSSECRLITRDGNEMWVLIDRRPVWDAIEQRVTRVYTVVRDITQRKAAELAPHHQEQLYHALLDNFPNGIVTLYDQDLRYLAVGGLGIGGDPQAARAMFEGKRLREIYPPEIYERDEPALKAALAGEARVAVIEHEGRFYQVHTIPVRDEEANVIAGLVITQDITELKRKEQVIRESEARYKLLYDRYHVITDNVNDIITQHDLEGYCTYASPSSEHVLGYKPEELVGLSTADFLHPDDQERVMDMLWAAYEFGQFQGVPVTYRLRHKEGHYIWAESSGRTILEPTTGQSLSQIIVTRDVTERKQQEGQLYYQSWLLGSVMDAIISVNLDFEIVTWNQAAEDLYGWRAEDVLGRRIDEIERMMHSINPLQAEQLEKHLKQHHTWSGEQTHINQAGEEFEVFVSASPVKDVSGEVIGFVMVNRDISEKKQLEARALDLAVQQERMNIIQKFISDASHDFKNPISILHTNLYLMRRALVDSQHHRRLDTMQHYVDHIAKLIDNLLMLLRLDSGGMLDLKPIDIHAEINTLLADTSPVQKRLNRRQVPIRFCPDGQSLVLWVDPQLFEKAIFNLLENALYHTGDAGVTIRTRIEDKHAIISVEDTGPGIPAADLPHIFDRFYRADKARAVDTGGSGLGLAIVQRIAQLHGGAVDVTSEQGKGSVFTIRLPMRSV